MKRLKNIRWLPLLLAVSLLAGCGAGNKASQRPSINTEFPGREITFSFSALPSEQLVLSGEGAAGVLEVVAQTQPDYAYEDLYQLEEVKSRLDFDASVENHLFSALDGSGTLSGDYLAALVEQNNEAFLAEKPFGYTAVEGDYIAQLCDFIVNTVGIMAGKYPDVDWERVYCNLGNLKILYDVGMLSYAQVNQDMILAISKNNTEIILNLKGEDGFGRVLTHEIMHIIQIGCVCENIENCGRRAGIAVYWDDFSLNTTDWIWMVEGAAERHMCTLTGGEAISYQYKMDYLCSLTMSVLLRDSVEADTMETLCFYSDPELLFDTFGCETEVQRDELLKMMVTLQVLQMQPKNFHLVYAETTGTDLMADEDAMNQFSYSLKPAVCTTLAKEFYENLVSFLRQNPVSCNDLFCLLTLFEGHLNQHLNYTSESKAEIKRPFIEAYTSMRGALFAALESDNPGVDVTALYAAYDITAVGEKLLNAELVMLPPEKLAFLAERAQWQSELHGLGQKVPFV